MHCHFNVLIYHASQATFAYVDDEVEVTVMESHIQEIVDKLRDSSDGKILLAKNVLREILKGNTST